MAMGVSFHVWCSYKHSLFNVDSAFSLSFEGPTWRLPCASAVSSSCAFGCSDANSFGSGWHCGRSRKANRGRSRSHRCSRSRSWKTPRSRAAISILGPEGPKKKEGGSIYLVQTDGSHRARARLSSVGPPFVGCPSVVGRRVVGCRSSVVCRRSWAVDRRSSDVGQRCCPPSPPRLLHEYVSSSSGTLFSTESAVIHGL